MAATILPTPSGNPRATPQEFSIDYQRTPGEVVMDSMGREVELLGFPTATITATLFLPDHLGNTGQPHLGMMGARVEFQGLVGVVTNYRYDFAGDFARVRVTVGACVPIADAQEGEVRRLVDVEWVTSERRTGDTIPPSSPGVVAKPQRVSRILLGKGKGDYRNPTPTTSRRIRLQNRGD